MTDRSLNQEINPNGTCFGCGLANERGFHTTFRRDPEGKRILGTVTVPEYATGLPSLGHGSVAFTALDCLAAWAIITLRPELKRIPVTRTASITYHLPTRPGQPLDLIGWVEKDSPAKGEPTIVRGEARDQNGNVVADGEFKMALVSPKTFKTMLGLTELPADWRPIFGEV